MKYAIVIIIKPDLTSLSGAERQWRDKVASAVSEVIKKSENTRTLGEYVLECCLNADLPLLNSFLNLLDIESIAYRITFLDSPLEWIECPKA